MLIPVIFFGVLALLATGIWVVSLIIFFATRSSPNRALKVVGRLPFFFVTGLGVLVVGAITFDFLSNDNPKNIFESEFGIAPTSDVKNLNSSYFSFGDTDSVILQFQAAPTTLKRITSSGFSHISKTQLDQSHGLLSLKSADDPSWWNPKITQKTLAWKGKARQNSGFATQNTWLIYDPFTRWAHYYSIAFD